MKQSKYTNCETDWCKFFVYIDCQTDNEASTMEQIEVNSQVIEDILEKSAPVIFVTRKLLYSTFCRVIN